MDNCDCKNYNCIYIISRRNIAVCFWSTFSKYIVFLIKISSSEEYICLYHCRNRIPYMNCMHIERFCKIQKLDNSFTLPKTVVKAKGIQSSLPFCDIWTTSRSVSFINSMTLKGGRMKATPVPLHKILSHTLCQNSYAPGQGLQKI